MPSAAGHARAVLFTIERRKNSSRPTTNGLGGANDRSYPTRLLLEHLLDAARGAVSRRRTSGDAAPTLGPARRRVDRGRRALQINRRIQGPARSPGFAVAAR